MPSLKNKTVCVTGAGGFIGSALCHTLLSAEAHVIALDNFSEGSRGNLKGIEADIEIVESDIRDLDSLRTPLKKSQVVFHLAALDSRTQCQKNFPLAVDINIKGTANILSLCEHVDRIIFSSSAMVYGEAEYLPIDESHPLSANEPYAVSKIASEQLFKAYECMHNIPYTIVRNFNTYGPRQNPNSLIPSLIIEGLTHDKIDVWSPDVVRDLQYVDDCATRLLAIAESGCTLNEILNLGTGHGITTGDLTQLICDILGTSWRDCHKPKPISSKLICNPDKLNSLVQLPTGIGLISGLKNTIEFYRHSLSQQ